MIYRIFLAVVVVASACLADGFFALKSGVAFPHTLSSLEQGDRAAWHFGCEWGGMIDNKVGIGGAYDMLFKSSTENSEFRRDTSSTSGIYETYKKGTGIRRRQFSLGAGIWVNPLNEFKIRPVLRGSFMPSMMVLINDEDTSTAYEDDVLPPSGVYWGFVGTAGADVHFMLSKSASIFIGAGYRFGSVRKRINYHPFAIDEEEEETNEEYEYLRQPMNGISFRFGFMFW